MPTVLIAILSVAALMRVAMAGARWRRRRALARAAHELGLRFSAEDPFDLPRRYAGSALMQLGHSACAENVVFGRLAGWPLRWFDYRFEAGHGPHRLTRQLNVVAAETQLQCGLALACRGTAGGEAMGVLCEVFPVEGGWWRRAAHAKQADRLIGAWPATGSEAVSIHAFGGVVLFALPQCAGARQLARQLTAVTDCLDALAAKARIED